MARGAFFRENMDRPKNNFPVCCLSLRESRNFRGAKGDNYHSAATKSGRAEKAIVPCKPELAGGGVLRENCGAGGRASTRRLYEP
jgi:hypothetical protein